MPLCAARGRGARAPMFCIISSQKTQILLKYFPEMQTILEAKDSPGRKADIELTLSK